MKKIPILICLLLMTTAVMAQSGTVYMTEANNGTHVSMMMQGEVFGLVINSENDGTGKYPDSVRTKRWLIVDSSSCEGDRCMSLLFTIFDIPEGDTLLIHDGAGLNAPVIFVANNVLFNLEGVTVFPGLYNTSETLTIELRTNGDGIAGNFSINVMCRDRCETIIPVIDSFYYKTRNGVIYDTMYTRMVTQVDTNWNADSTSFTLDTSWFRGVHICVGDGVIFHGHGEYTNLYGYGAEDFTSQFEWNFGNGNDTVGVCMNLAPAYYSDIDCYDVTLRIMDKQGCYSTIMESVRVRVAQNPLKTIYDLNPMCTTDSSIVNIGYEGANATITMQKISFNKTKSRSIDCKTFIPDGPRTQGRCGDSEKCFNATITFDDFPSGRVVQSAEDICSICINIEHEYLGDILGRIVCPTGQKARLWYANVGHDPDLMSQTDVAELKAKGELYDGMYNGNGKWLGFPYGGNSHHNYDEQCTGVEDWVKFCDSICNMYGEGWDYCFSLNANYKLNNGKNANTDDHDPSNYFCQNNAGNDTTVQGFNFGVIPAPFVQAGQMATNCTTNARTPSNHEKQTGYYQPASDFSSLVGCPLNGDWTVQICDNFGQDNGWIFSWAIDFCGISSGVGCEYQVGIDSVLWWPDSAYGDFDLGHWRGLNIDMNTPTRSVIKSPDTAGYFPINVRIFDEFGCIWDTTTGIRTVWSPTPNIGDTVIVCDVETITLDASDRHTPITNQTFKWEPFGQTTDTIETKALMGTSTLYTVEVENFEYSTSCRTRDSVRVNINPQPMANFDPGVYPLEGCEPYTIHFENTSQFGEDYMWVFGDGDTSRAQSPTHTYGTGQYDFKYFVGNKAGCRDSLVYSKLITVYPSPVARFSWEPMNPTVMHPSVTFHNLTIPQSDENRYYWEIQYDRDNDVSYHTLRDVNPTFEWETDGSDISGNYTARLIAMTSNMGPSGYVIECRDTVESRILLVNDFLQFPNAVTPNGDGVNDKFIIRNLVNGLGYPNNSLAIYDRWGKRIFYKENIASEDDFWDPAATNTPAGTYFWRFNGKGYLGDIQRNGVIEVIY
ncbi:MAG: gliding motility-associated C-terminal domain-containing protein [Bacteroidales bacterium]|nr:gliding motility-associated C-terminal domain-containing protein [Bacteroidales bacterium]